MSFRRLRILTRESHKSLVSTPIISMGTVILVACICFVVLFISGRAVGVQQDILSTIDAAETRKIIVKNMSGDGMDSAALQDVNSLGGVQWSVALGPAYDLERSDDVGEVRISARDVWTSDFSYINLPQKPIGERAEETFYYGSSAALQQLGINDELGYAALSSGDSVAVLRAEEVSSQFGLAQNSFLHPRSESDRGLAEIIVIMAESSHIVSSLADAIPQVSNLGDAGSLSVTTSENFIELQKVLDGKLGAVRYDLVTGIFALGLILIALLQVSSIMTNRKDYGRRRALGASARLFFFIIIIQNFILSIFGVCIGSLTALSLLLLRQYPLPNLSFIFSVIILSIFVVLGSSLIAARYASTRDPASELRIA